MDLIPSEENHHFGAGGSTAGRIGMSVLNGPEEGNGPFAIYNCCANSPQELLFVLEGHVR